MFDETEMTRKWREWAENTTDMAEALAAPEVVTQPAVAPEADVQEVEPYTPPLEELWNPKPF
ncbi:MAG: hypothetical protein NZ828_06715 [Alphaproteobacteria bacterium]|jgi:hypothetical protein|nr:hypothetical protein [Alphaproteobacteria bacterium]